MSTRSLLLAPLAIVAISLVAMATASRVYWGYWFRPPSSEGTAACLASLDRFTSNRPGGPAASGPAALMREAASVNYLSGEIPLGRLAAALVRRQLIPASSEPVAPSLLPAITASLAAAGVLRTGDPGYPNAGRLQGHIAVGRNSCGQPIVLAALNGSEASNDHYPYYEAAFDVSPRGELVLSRLRFYWFDFAGIEGLLGCLTAVAVAVPLLFIWLLMVAFRVLAPLWSRTPPTAA